MITAGAPISKSRFYMLRCIIAMAHADGIVKLEESEKILGMMNRLNLDYNQRQVLTRDMRVPQDVETLLPEVTEPKYRAQIVDFARMLAHHDGQTSPSEEELLQKLQIRVTEGLDMDAIRADVRANVAQELSNHDIEVDSKYPKSFLERAIECILSSLSGRS